MNDAEDPCVHSSANVCRPTASGLAMVVWITGGSAMAFLGVISLRGRVRSNKATELSLEIEIGGKKFRKGSLINEGAMGKVYRAEEVQSGRTVAWKEAYGDHSKKDG